MIDKVILVDFENGQAWDLTQFANEMKDLSEDPSTDLISLIKNNIHEVGFNLFRIMNGTTAGYLSEVFDDIDYNLSLLAGIAEAEKSESIYEKAKEGLM